MFGLSFPELLIVLVLALIVLGPERLPKVARTIGKGMREIRKVTGDFKDVVETEMYKLEEDVTKLPEARPAHRAPAEEQSVSFPAGPAPMPVSGPIPRSPEPAPEAADEGAPAPATEAGAATDPTSR